MLKRSFTPQTRPLAASALAMFIAMPICASAGTFNITTTVTSSQTLSGTDTGTVTSTGSISVPFSTAIRISSGATGNVSNAGTISSASTGSWASGINASITWGGSLTNSGTINATHSNWSATAKGVFVDTWNNANALNNSGTISASATAKSWSAIARGVRGVAINGNLTNSGFISAVANGWIWANAEGIGFRAMTGTLNNSGTISADASSVRSAATALAVNLFTIDGTFTNSGTISAIANASTSATARGVTIGTMRNNLTNSGTISTEATSGTSSALAKGISLGNMTGTLTNSGDINANANGRWDSATGIYVNGNLTGDLVNNTGAIISATAATSIAYGVNIGFMAGNITNNGTIRASGGLWDTALRIRGGMLGNINNSGIISSTRGDGIYISDWNTMSTASGTIYALNGSITNSGTITAGSTGIRIDGNLIGNITNSGTISASAGILVGSNLFSGSITNNGIINATWEGIWVNGDVNGNIINNGTITASAGSSGAIYVGGAVNGSITNNGTIASGSNGITTYDVLAGGSITNKGTIASGSWGITVRTNNAGTINNQGSIDAWGVGINMRGTGVGDTGTILNSGNITAQSTAAIRVQADTGYNYVITNTGTITGSSGAAAIRSVSGGTGTLNQNAGTITGAVVMGWDDDTVNINGGSIVGTLGGGTQSVADTLNFNAASYTLQGEVTGFEEVNFNKGMTDLNGFSIFNGGSATIASGAGVVMNGGNGGNKIQGSLTNNGLLDVGYGGSTITGDYTQTAGSTTRFDLYHSASDVLDFFKDPSLSSGLDVNGTAVLGNVEAHVAGIDYIRDGSTFWVMTAFNALDTTNLKLSDNSAVLDFTADTTTIPSEMLLTAHRVATYQSLAGSNYGLAGKLDAIGAAGGYTAEQMAMLGALDASPTGTALTKQLADWSPDATGAELEGSRSVTNTVGNVIGQRIDSQLASAGHGKGMAAGDAFRDSGIWLQGFFGSATQDGTLGNNGYDASNSGFVIGGDTSVTANARVGLSLASTKNKVDLVNGATPDKLDIDSTHITVYGSYEANSWNLAGMLASSSHDYDSTRNAINKASYSGSQLTMKVQGGFPMAMGGMKVTPVASFSHSTLDLDGYTETGAGGLTVRSSSYDSNEVGVGALVAKEIKRGNLTWVPRASLRYRHEMGDVKQETNATLDSAGISFTTNGIERSRGTVEVGLGVDMLSGERFAVQADYQLDSRGGYSANTGRLSVRYKF